MKTLIAFIALIPFVLCKLDHKLPSVRQLLSKQRITCEDFIKTEDQAFCYPPIQLAVDEDRVPDHFPNLDEKVTRSPKESACIFQFDNVYRTFAEAEAMCIQRGGHLLSIDNEEEQTALEDLLTARYENGMPPTAEEFWLGGMRKEDSNLWTWTDGTTLTPHVKTMELPIDTRDMDKDSCLSTKSAIDTTNGDWETGACGRYSEKKSICKFIYNKNAKIFVSSHHAAKTWYNALEHCMELNGNLATIHDVYESRSLRKILHDRNDINTWIGLNDLNKEGKFEWSDYSMSNYRGFCKPKIARKPDTKKDCAIFEANGHAGRRGCTKMEDCIKSYPYMCTIKSKACDDHSLTMHEYMTTILKDVSSARRTCRPCKSNRKHFLPKKSTKKTTKISKHLLR